jgi:hypothetical protein
VNNIKAKQIMNININIIKQFLIFLKLHIHKAK